MSHSHYHAQSSARRFGGKPEDYTHLHDWFDETKAFLGDARHRALRHHSQGIFELERTFGKTITNSDGRVVPVRLIGEQHVREDCGGIIPTVADWLGAIRTEPWMNLGYRRSLAVERGSREAPVPLARNSSAAPAKDAPTRKTRPRRPRIAAPLDF